MGQSDRAIRRPASSPASSRICCAAVACSSPSVASRAVDRVSIPDWRTPALLRISRNAASGTAE